MIMPRWLLIGGAVLVAAATAAAQGRGHMPARPAPVHMPARPAMSPVARPAVMPSMPISRPVAMPSAPISRPVAMPSAPSPVVTRPTLNPVTSPVVTRPTLNPVTSPVVTRPTVNPAVSPTVSRPTVSPTVSRPVVNPGTGTSPTVSRPTVNPAGTSGAVRPGSGVTSTSLRPAASSVVVNNTQQTITLPNGQTVSPAVFHAFALSQASSPNSWFWGVTGLYPFYAPYYNHGFYSPFYYAPFAFGYGYGGYGYGSGINFAYRSGSWAIGASIGFPAYSYQSAPTYYAPYSPPTTVVAQSSPAVIPPASETTLPPPVVQADKPATETSFAAQGMEYFQAGKYPEAVKSLRHAVVDDPRNGGLLGLTGQALFAAGSLDEAAGALQQSLAATPEAQWVDASSKLAKLAPAEATETLRKAIEKDSGAPALRFLAAYQAFGQADYKQAQTHVDALLKVAPDDPVAKKLQAQVRKLAPGKE
jgi:tetratricopeptide (TPR) repeat protein